MPKEANFLTYIGGSILCLAILLGIFMGMFGAEAQSTQNALHSVTVMVPLGVNSLILDNASSIVLIANATKTVTVNFTVTGGNGCGSVFFGGNVTTTLYRSDVSSTCATSSVGAQQFNYLNCYYVATTTNNCSGPADTSSANATASIDVWYFADATDSSSSYSAQNWLASVFVRDSSSTTANATTVSGMELLSLNAVSLTSSTLSYGTLTPSSTTGSSTQISTVKNAGNTSTSLQISGSALTSGANSMPTSSQHYASSSFTYGGGEQALQGTATTVSGWLVQKAPLGNNWATTTPLRFESYFHAAVMNNSFIYVLGGSDSGANYTSTVQYAPINATGSLGAWATTTPLRSTLVGHAAIVNNGFIYVIGGSNLGGVTSTVQYAPINATGSLGAWATTTPLRSVSTNHAAIVNNGFIYVMGGNDDGGNYTSTVQYAPINATGSLGAWATTTPFSRTLISHSAVVYNGFLYALGGAYSIGNYTSTVQYAQINSTGSLGTWVITTPLQTKLFSHAAVVNNGFIYVTGGSPDGFGFLSNVSYAPVRATGELGAWSTTTQSRMGLYLHAAVVNNSFIYAMGGSPDGSSPTSTVEYVPLPSRNLYFGLGVPSSTIGGAYSSTITYTSVYTP